MKCAEIKKLFSPYLDGRVSGAEMRSLTSHVEQCAACAGEYAAQKRRPRYEGVAVQLQDMLDAFMVPATAGLVSAVLFFGLLFGFFALPAELRASSVDVPLMLYTGPQLEQSAFGTSLGDMGEDAVVIEAYVDANGRVEDYRILSQPDDAKAV